MFKIKSINLLNKNNPNYVGNGIEIEPFMILNRIVPLVKALNLSQNKKIKNKLKINAPPPHILPICVPVYKQCKSY